MENNNGFLAAFIVIIISIAFITTIADNIYANRTVDRVYNETTDVLNDATNYTDLDNNYVQSITECINSTGNTQVITSSNYSVNYVTGRITINKGVTTKMPWTTKYWNCSYDYEPDLYVRSSMARTILNLIPIFLVLALIGVVIFYTISGNFRDYLNGLMGR